MARNVYSTRFLSLGIAGTSVTYVVPAGYVAVVRSVDMVYIGGPTASNGLVFINGVHVPLTYLYNLSGNDERHLETHQVVNAGDPIGIAAGGSNTLYVSVSGYLLTLP